MVWGNYVLDGSGTLFAKSAASLKSSADAAALIGHGMLGSAATPTSLSALTSYAATRDILGTPAAFAGSALNAALRKLASAAIAAPEFQLR
jgi:hypothetical protein